MCFKPYPKGCYMARKTFLFRLDDVNGEIILRALEGRFPAAGVQEKAEIARVTVRLRRKLKQVTDVTRGSE